MTPFPANVPSGAPDELRAIDERLARWVQARTGSALLAWAAQAASAAEGRGHACASLDPPDFDAAQLVQLRAHAWIGDGSQFTPLVLDAQDRCYLWRNWEHETRLAENLLHRRRAGHWPVDAATLGADLEQLFAGTPREATLNQRAAAAAAPGAQLFVLTGGPGTGKTTTALRILLMLLRHAKACGLPETPSIALAAPTGKAAQRLAQAIAHGKATLRSQLGDDATFAPLLEHIPHAEARTLHRLLGFDPRENRFTRGKADPLAADIVVVDEASMIDLAVMRQLLDAMRPEAVLVLLGDPDQLASVDAGSVLADIVASASRAALPDALAAMLDWPQPPSNTSSPLNGNVLALTHVWRAGSGLQRSIAALRGEADGEWLEQFLAAGHDGDLHWLSCDDPATLRTRCEAWLDRQQSRFDALLRRDVAADTALAVLRDMQLLCALREGTYGAQSINLWLGRRLGERYGFDGTRPWYHGRPVIVMRNDYVRGLFNGDVGIALQGADGLRVWFEGSDRDGHPGLRSYSPRALPAHDTAWAITIHRSQGSEYRDVAVVLPPDPNQRMLSRELLYTAVSRARTHAELWSSAAALRAAASRTIERQGGLRERLLQDPGGLRRPVEPLKMAGPSPE